MVGASRPAGEAAGGVTPNVGTTTVGVNTPTPALACDYGELVSPGSAIDGPLSSLGPLDPPGL